MSSLQPPSAPIHTLPIELLSRIFKLGSTPLPWESDSPFVLKSDDSYSCDPNPTFQVLVSHVCSHWRRLALSIPTLWASLCFQRHSHLRRAELFLSRTTSSTLLSIVIDIVSRKKHIPGVTLYHDELHKVADIVIPHLSRFRCFSIKVRDQVGRSAARQRFSKCGGAPNLETLQLYHVEECWTSRDLHLSTVRRPCLVFSGFLPRLKHLSLIGVHLPWENVHFLQGLHNIEFALHPENTRLPYELWDDMLRSSPHLKRLWLHYSGPRTPVAPPLSPPPPSAANGSLVVGSDSHPPHEPIHLPSVEEISLTDLDPDYVCQLFKHLSTPALSHLSVDLPDQNFTPFVLQAAGAINAPTEEGAMEWDPCLSLSGLTPPPPLFPHLHTLVVSALECCAESWRSWLISMPSLKVLEVDFGRVSEGFYHVLVGGGGFFFCRCCSESGRYILSHESPKKRTPLLPELEVMKVSSLSGPSLRDLIGYRERSGYGVRRWCVKLYASRKGEDEVLDQLVENGWVGEVDGCVKKVMVECVVEEETDEDSDEDGDGNDVEMVEPCPW
jgi:hypothetical protein